MRKALRRTFWGVAAALAIAIAVPFVVPVARFIPELTRLASEKLGQPVAMEDLRLHLLPTPRVVGHRITIGARAQLLIGELAIAPDLISLVSGPPAVRLIHASGVTLDESVLNMPRGMPKARAGDPLPVRRLVLSSVKLKHSKIDLPLFDIDLKLGDGLRLREARVETSDGTARVLLESIGSDTTAVLLSAINWTLPGPAPITFNALAAQGILKGQHLELAKIEGELYGGQVLATAQADWGNEWQLVGKAQLTGVELAPLQKALGKPARLSGRLKAEAAFSTRAKIPAELKEALALDGPFEVLGGVYQGVDLSRAAAEGQREESDATTFEELKGMLEMRGDRMKLNQLCMRSPKLVAGGNVEIAPDKSVSGTLDISVAQTGGIVGMPVTLGGTTDDPTMRPTKGAIIGAAIGTVILPGIGTSIGSSLGGRIGIESGCR